MITTANLLELQQIINSSHGDPHHILGMHEIKTPEGAGLAVRAFIPQAKKIVVLDPQKPGWELELPIVHRDGFFEGVIKRSKWFRYQLRITAHDGNEWTTHDPYSFAPVLSDLDLHLFGEGTHYKIFDKLGAHFMNIDGVDGVLFAVWAPNAQRISLIGDFNGWDGRRHPMRVRSNSGLWELFVPGLQQYDRYKFEIKALDGRIFQKSDPYASFCELRPSTSSLVYDIYRYEWKDAEWLKRRAAENILGKPVNIYEVHPGSWKRGSDNEFLTYSGLEKELIPYVKEMGYTHIELMPIEEHPFDGSWGYQVTGYYAPTSRYGNPDEFMHFVDACHINGLGLILDWVPAHFPKDAHGLARFDGTALYEHQDPRLGEHPDWGTLIFNYGRKEVKNFLIANALFWIEKYHIDGLRVDAVASMLYLNYGKNDGQWIPNKYGGNENFEAAEFMKHMNSVLLGTHPGVMMIAEESTAWAGVSRPPETGGLGFNLKWNMGWMNDFTSYIANDPIYRSFHHWQLTFGMVYAYSENFVLVLSHDEVVHGKRSMINKMPGDLWQKCANLRLSYAFMYGHPGKKLLFMGGEFGQFDEWSEARQLDWFLLEFDHHRQIQSFVRDLNNLYKNEISMWYDDFEGQGFEWIDCMDSARSYVAFFRKAKKEEDILVFVCNFTPNPILEHRLGVPYAGYYKEILNSDDKKYGGSGITNEFVIKADAVECTARPYSIGLRVPPLGAIILKYQKNKKS